MVSHCRNAVKKPFSKQESFCVPQGRSRKQVRYFVESVRKTHCREVEEPMNSNDELPEALVDAIEVNDPEVTNQPLIHTPFFLFRRKNSLARFFIIFYLFFARHFPRKSCVFQCLLYQKLSINSERKHVFTYVDSYMDVCGAVCTFFHDKISHTCHASSRLRQRFGLKKSTAGVRLSYDIPGGHPVCSDITAVRRLFLPHAFEGRGRKGGSSFLSLTFLQPKGDNRIIQVCGVKPSLPSRDITPLPKVENAAFGQ